ncbi:MAG: hypothetical protein QM767_00070 [Anaeromyxobacter sp.]
MHLGIALAVSALVAALVLLVTAPSRLLPLVAALSAAVIAGIAMGKLPAHLFGFPLAPVLAVALAVPAAITWLRCTTKTSISAGAVATFIGALDAALWILQHR